MSKIERIENDLKSLPRADLRKIRDWLNDFVEDEMEFTSEFEADICESEREMKAGVRPRTRRP